MFRVVLRQAQDAWHITVIVQRGVPEILCKPGATELSDQPLEYLLVLIRLRFRKCGETKRRVYPYYFLNRPASLFGAAQRGIGSGRAQIGSYVVLVEQPAG